MTSSLGFRWDKYLMILLAGAPLACASPQQAGPPAAGTLTATTGGGEAAASMTGWHDPPVNGSPGMNPPPLSGPHLVAKETFKDGKSLPWTTTFREPADGQAAVEHGE